MPAHVSPLTRRTCLVGMAGLAAGPFAGPVRAWPLTGPVRYPATASFGVEGGKPPADGGGFGDSPPSGHHIADSQVFFVVPSLAPGVGAVVGGMLGALIGGAVAQGRSSDQAAPLATLLRHRFDGLVRPGLDQRLAGLAARYRRAADDTEADIRLTPSLTIIAHSESSPMLRFRLAVDFPNAAGSGRAFKAYLHDRDRNRPLQGANGWLEDGAAPLVAAASESFGLLLDLMVEDLQGAFDPVFEPDTAPALRWQHRGDDVVMYGVLLRETPQHVLIAGQYRLAANPAAIRLVDRALFSVAAAEQN